MIKDKVPAQPALEDDDYPIVPEEKEEVGGKLSDREMTAEHFERLKTLGLK